MKTTLPLAVLSCLLLFAFAVYTQQQQPAPEQVQHQIDELLRYMSSPRKQLDEEAQEIPANRSSWNGQGTWMPLRMFVRLGGEAELGLTEAQKQRLPFLYKENELGREWFDKMRQNPTPEYTQAMQTLQTISATFMRDDPFLERATDELKDAYREASAATTSLWLAAMQADIEETLTSEQMLQVRKLEMQLMPAMGIPFPSMFDPLGLTDEQKEEMNEIADEMKAEFDLLTQEAAMLKAERIVSVYKSLQGKTFSSRDEFDKVSSETHRKFEATETMRQKRADLQERGTKFTTLLQNRLMNVLTDEQLDKMQKIMDESPRFVKQVLARFKASQGAQEKSPSWVPGPDSWRPGDPLPAQFKEERKKGNFPRQRSE
jgi:hypothetical protein